LNTKLDGVRRVGRP